MTQDAYFCLAASAEMSQCSAFSPSADEAEGCSQQGEVPTCEVKQESKKQHRGKRGGQKVQRKEHQKMVHEATDTTEEVASPATDRRKRAGLL